MNKQINLIYLICEWFHWCGSLRRLIVSFALVGWRKPFHSLEWNGREWVMAAAPNKQSKRNESTKQEDKQKKWSSWREMKAFVEMKLNLFNGMKTIAQWSWMNVTRPSINSSIIFNFIDEINVWLIEDWLVGGGSSSFHQQNNSLSFPFKRNVFFDFISWSGIKDIITVFALIKLNRCW